jgi:hypothetical protein
MKLADIPPGSELAYRCAAKQIAEQLEFELETWRQLLGTEPEKVLQLLANTPDWTVFFRRRGPVRFAQVLSYPTARQPHLTKFEHNRRGEW